jgi:hypothetical protein
VKQAANKTHFLLGLTFNPEDEGHLRRWNSEEVKHCKVSRKKYICVKHNKHSGYQSRIFSAILE